MIAHAVMLATVVASSPAASPDPAAGSRPAPPQQAPPASAVGVSDLPVVEVPSTSAGTWLVVLLSGDGGWAGFDRAFSAAMARAGVPVAGLDSLRYFWKRRSLEETARDVARILSHYRAAWHRDGTILVGYSRGADIVPLVARELPPAERAHLRLVAMIGPSTFAELEVHAVDLLANVKRKGAIPTEDAVRGSDGKVRMLCLHGKAERGSLCPRIADLPFVVDVVHEGGHRLGGGDESLARIVLDAAR